MLHVRENLTGTNRQVVRCEGGGPTGLDMKKGSRPMDKSLGGAAVEDQSIRCIFS